MGNLQHLTGALLEQGAFRSEKALDY